MTEKNVVKYSLAHLQSLEVGDKVVFPIEQLNTVRTQVSTYGAIWDRVFKTRMVREERTLEVVRIR